MPLLKRRKGESKEEQTVRTAMTERKAGKLHSGSKTGPKVTSRKQALAIALSEARKNGAVKAPSKKRNNRPRNKGR